MFPVFFHSIKVLWIDFKTIKKTNLGTDNCLLESLLYEVGEDVVAGTGREARVAVEAAVAETVAKVLENLEQLLGGVLVDGQHLGAIEVVDNKEGWLRVGLVAPKQPNTESNAPTCQSKIRFIYLPNFSNDSIHYAAISR